MYVYIYKLNVEIFPTSNETFLKVLKKHKKTSVLEIDI